MTLTGGSGNKQMRDQNVPWKTDPIMRTCWKFSNRMFGYPLGIPETNPKVVVPVIRRACQINCIEITRIYIITIPLSHVTDSNTIPEQG